jgi:hypothetical protein
LNSNNAPRASRSHELKTTSCSAASSFPARQLAVPLPKLAVGGVDRLQQAGEARRLLDGPQAGKGGAQQAHVPLRQQPYGNDTFPWQIKLRVLSV